MSIRINKAIVLIGISVVVLMLCRYNMNVAEAKTETYIEKDMEFVVGKHVPEKRINPKRIEGVTVTQIIVVDSEHDNVLPQDEEEATSPNKEEGSKLKEADITDAGATENKKSFSVMFKEVLNSIKDLWEKLTSFEKKTETRLNIIEDKLEVEKEIEDEITEEEIEKNENDAIDKSNVEELIELTSQITEEMEEQENRIIELEAENNKQKKIISE
jgi:hypothetical protein